MKLLQPIESNLLQQLTDRIELVSSQPIEIQIALAQDLQTPRSILQVLVDRAEASIAEIAKLHINYAGELTTDGREEIDAIFKTAQLGQNDRLAVELLKLGGVPAEFISEWVPAKRLIDALKNPYLSTNDRVKFLARLAEDNKLEPRLEVAESIDTPPTILGQLLGDIELAVRLATQHNPNCPVDVSELINIQQSLASNWDTDSTELAILGKSHWSWIRLKVAQNPSASAETLRKLALDRVYKIQLAVANNPHTPAEVLEILLGNSEPEIQAAIASHPNASAETLFKLFCCRSRDITRKQNLPAQLLQKIYDNILDLDWERNIKYVLIRQVNTPTEVLAKLSECNLAEIKAELLARGYSPEIHNFRELIEGETNYLADIARHPNVSVEILQKLFQYNNNQLRMAIAKNPLTPRNIRQNLLSKFTNREKIEVWIELINNPITQSSFRMLLIDLARKENEKIGDENQNIQLLAALANNPDFSVEERDRYLQQLLKDPGGRVYLSTDPQTPVEILERLLNESTGEKIEEKLVDNPITPDYLLQRIGDEPYDRHWYEIVRHPNAPLELLKRYASQEPKNFRSCETRFEMVLQNPNLPLLEGYRLRLNKYEEQNLKTTNEILLRRPNSLYASAKVLETQDRNAKIAAVRNPSTPIDIIEKLAKDSDEMVRAILIDGLHLPLHVKLLMTNDASINIRCKLAQKHTYRDTPVEVLEKLANDESAKVRAIVAANSCTPVINLIQLANDPDYDIKKSLVTNHNTPVEVLNRLGLEEGIFDIRNPNTPGAVLDRAVKLIQQGQGATTLENFLKHPVKGSQMPAKTLAKLANNNNSSVRYRVAQHPNTPPNTLQQLATNNYVPTLRAVAENPNTPSRSLKELANHPDFTTCHNVVYNRNTPASVLTQIVKSSLTSDNVPNLTVDALKSALPGDRYGIYQSIAIKSNTPLEALEILARREFIRQPIVDSNSMFPSHTADDVVCSLAHNPNLTSDLLEILSQDRCIAVRVAISSHPNLTPQLWIKLTNDESVEVRSSMASSPLTPSNILDLLSTDREVEVREKLVINRNTPASILDRLATDNELNVRMAIALNPNTSIDTLDRLAADEKIEVRRAVSRNPQTPQTIKDKLRDLLPQSIVRSRSSTLRSLPRIYNPQTDDLPTILSEYAQSENVFVRLITLRHPLTPIEILERGMRSSKWFDRYAVADNPATPTHIRQQLTQDSNRIVRAISIANLR